MQNKLAVIHNFLDMHKWQPAMRIIHSEADRVEYIFRCACGVYACESSEDFEGILPIGKDFTSEFKNAITKALPEPYKSEFKVTAQMKHSMDERQYFNLYAWHIDEEHIGEWVTDCMSIWLGKAPI